MKSAVTISLVPEARGGPFVYWDDLPVACRLAKEAGFDAVELFAPGPDAVPAGELSKLLADNGLSLAAVGTGAGWVKHKLTLTHPDATIRQRATDFIRAMIEFGAANGAPAIIGSMQGRWGDGTDRDTAVKYLAEALSELAPADGMLIYEPLNRYETNLANTLEQGVQVLDRVGNENVKLLADLFHMNIEEVNLPAAIRAAGPRIGHVHLADSNRRPAGDGHTLFPPIAAALRELRYDGYVSAECFPYPDPDVAAKNSLFAFRQFFT